MGSKHIQLVLGIVLFVFALVACLSLFGPFKHTKNAVRGQLKYSGRIYYDYGEENIDIVSLEKVGEIRYYVGNRLLNETDKDYTSNSNSVGIPIYQMKNGNLVIKDKYGTWGLSLSK